ncbi:MAG: HlyD family efflux transporter periplasmic adaptor subunit [Proteobacteria bacterium]|jgi:multidrug efflux pump subunit AcrA (membrane-fusion protein)|nr:HlyD family efflux transporter periplasmic adaptor subunit [Pseudomonadota bacterium]MBT5794460.1 HlyD family efflux transporter periplasmic adaptor subunit [Deltaproteobacteria bacterium]
MWKKIFNLKFWLPVLVLLLGVGITMALLKNKPTARKKSNFQRGTLVTVIEAKLSNPQIEVRTHGRVQAAQKVVLSARIGGEVIWISPNLSEGSFFKKNELLLSIGIRQSQSSLKAPFDGVVQLKNVDLGQYVNPGTQLATLIGSDHAEVVIDLPMSRLEWLPKQLPNELPANSKEKVAKQSTITNQYQLPAEISLAGISSASAWPAVVKRQLLELTPRGMMVQLIAEVKDPFQLKISLEQNNKEISVNGAVIKKIETFKKDIPEKEEFFKIPLFIGSFVDVKIPGRQLTDVVQIPAKALRDRDTVWVVVNKQLQIRNVKIAHIDLDNVYISGGVTIGEKIVISPIKGASKGLKVRIDGDNEIGPERNKEETKKSNRSKDKWK